MFPLERHEHRDLHNLYCPRCNAFHHNGLAYKDSITVVLDSENYMDLCAEYDYDLDEIIYLIKELRDKQDLPIIIMNSQKIYEPETFEQLLQHYCPKCKEFFYFTKIRTIDGIKYVSFTELYNLENWLINYFKTIPW